MGIKLMITSVVWFLGFGLAISSLASSNTGNFSILDPRDVKFERGREINAIHLKEVENALRKSPGFDLKHSKVIEILTWEGLFGPGMIAAVREGVGISAGCAIYEKIGDSGFEYVNGEPFCSFSNPSGRIDNKSGFRVKFFGRIRQSSDSPLNSMEFDLFYDERRGFFCDPLSSSGKYNCGKNLTDQREN